MKSPALIRTALLLALAVSLPANAKTVGRVFAMQQATVRIVVTGGPTIYIDPTDPTVPPADADFILLTHNHGDHQSIPILTRLRKPGTVFVSSPPGVPALMTNFPTATIQAVTPGMKFDLGGVEVETVPMYNRIKLNNHPRVLNYVGYVVNVGGVRVYQAGDTERIPEMRQFAADVVMLPLGQTFTMESVRDAVAAAFDLKARIAIPIHWGNAEGTDADADYFVGQLSGWMQAMKRTPAEGLALEVSETVAIAEHPASTTVAPGSPVTLRVQATGSGTLRYQWRRNGEAIPAATGAALTLASAAAADAADYEVLVADANGPVRSRPARLTVAAPQPGRLVNLSVRAPAQGGGAALIVGAVVAGGGRDVLVRGVGPTLAAFGVTGAIPDPRLEVFGVVAGRSTSLAVNNDWSVGGAPAAAALRNLFAAVGAFGLGFSAREAAVVVPMDGVHTVHVSDTAGRPGVALAELYDTQTGGGGRFTNLSVRGAAGTRENVLTVGFVINGNVPRRLLLRAVGPRLASGFGVSGALADPRLELYLNDEGRPGLFAANDNWGEGGVAALRAAFAAAGAFDLPDGASRDAAMVITVPAGAFTAQVTGSDGTTGETLVEIYELP
ncbi:MAG: MBL fold metallo-hydrolase [Verrucomicrobia bacterium]|nr:MBL fold metallo-hydrolase [Verrucomicrobiota bacterium]